ncbi:hypothetical protein HPG69_011362, partial [Diceros bicornis minor]
LLKMRGRLTKIKELFLMFSSTMWMQEILDMIQNDVLKSHLPLHLTPPFFWKQNCKKCRRLPGVLLTPSHSDFILPDPQSLEEFCEKCMSRKVDHGSWYNHMKGQQAAKGKHWVLYLFYDDVKKNPKCESHRLLEFLEKTLSEDIINKIIHYMSFDVMKENPMVNQAALPSPICDYIISKFLRKGMPGDWKNHFTPAMNEKFAEHYKKMTGTTLTFCREI